ncbi:type II toxin-antitoxin system RelE/ParE family toxin [uncultured Bacteroides sp.]|uniref:type II toxin-antitoxin system RelE/ParE family toxin n=1 Tax=uncultured Bacteroides sp. TaxID=162156 RepID=UPI002AAA6940|nr:type II toxin-antitoxin system RelE/ParE family toxin [uncultured Bacteroides sp.]
MKIKYSSNKLEKQLTVPKDLSKKFGTMAKKMAQRISELKAAETLEDMRSLPAANCHELKGNRKGKLAVDISANYRLFFEPCQNPIPQKEDGGLEWILITEIEIITTEDYH